MNTVRLVLVWILLVPCGASAAIKYLREGAPAGGNGDNWTTAYNSISQLSGGLNRGDTGYIADGTYVNQGGWNKTASGTTPITIKKATIADHGTNTGWSDTYGDGQAVLTGTLNINSPYYVFDGQVGGGPTSWKTGYGFKVMVTGAADGPGICLRSGASDTIIRHFEVHGSWPVGSTHGFADGLNVFGGAPRSTFSYCYVHDMSRCPMYNSADDTTFEYIYAGRFHATGEHSETLSSQEYADGSGQFGRNNLTVRWSMLTWFASTGGLLTKGNGVYIYGNVFHRDPANSTAYHPHGFHGSWTQKPLSNMYAWNNTYIDPNPGPDADGSPFFNYSGGQNTVDGIGVGRYIHNAILFKDNVWTGTTFDGVTAHNYNHFAQIVGVTPNAVAGEANGSSSGADPFISYTSGNYGLTAAQAEAILAGQDLTGVSPYNTKEGYNRDMFGTVRGADGKWDRGAIEFVAEEVDVTPPTVSTATIDAEGDNLVVVFNEAATYNSGSGMSIDPSGDAATLSNPQQTGVAEITWDISRSIDSSESATISYATTANGIEDVAGNDLAATSTPINVTNNATVGMVGTPTISLPSGFYFDTQNVTLTPTTSGSTIRYTIDGTTPTSSTGIVYSTPIPLSIPTDLRARAFKVGETDSGLAAATYQIGTWVFIQSTGQWIDFAVPQQTGIFTWRFRASVTSGASDSVIGMGPTPDFTHWDNTAVALRFKTTGVIDCINGGAGGGTGTIYEAVNVFNYSALLQYDFVVTVNVLTRRYSATVVRVGTSPPTVIADNYEFRNGHELTSDLDNVGALGLNSDTTVSDMSFVAEVANASATVTNINATNAVVSP